MTPRMVTVHCSDSPDGRPETVGDIRQWHKARGFKDIGYHFVIYVDGSVHPGRPIAQEGAHVEGHNQDNVGICMVGKSRFSQDQWDCLRKLLGYLMKQYSIPLEQVYCHREWDTAKAQGKTCPNFEGDILRAWLKDANAAAPAENVLPSNSSTALPPVLP